MWHIVMALGGLCPLNLFLDPCVAQKVTVFGCFFAVLAVFGRFWPFLAMHDGLGIGGILRWLWGVYDP